MEVPVESHKPSHQGEEELSEGRMDIEEVGSLEVIGSKLSKTKVSRQSPKVFANGMDYVPCQNGPHQIQPHWDG